MNKSTQRIFSFIGQETGTTNAINFCLVLAALGKLKKVKCPPFTRKKHFTGAILNKGIHEAESRAQQCLSRVGEEAGTALCT